MTKTKNANCHCEFCESIKYAFAELIIERNFHFKLINDLLKAIREKENK